MAVATYGTAGGYARQVVADRARQVAIGVGLLWVVFAFAFHLLPQFAWWMSLPVLSVALWWHRGEIRNLFMPWIKGARGEEAVGRTLAQLEPDGFRILHDIDTGRGNLDHVVVGPTGVWAIETKAWTGRVWVGKSRVLMRNGQDETRTLRQATAEALEVKRRVAYAGLQPWVHALVVLTTTAPSQGALAFGTVKVLHISRLLEVIRSAPARMSPADVATAAGAVMMGRGTRNFRVAQWS